MLKKALLFINLWNNKLKDEKVLRQMRKKRPKLGLVDLHKKHFFLPRERRKVISVDNDVKRIRIPRQDQTTKLFLPR